MGEATRAHIRAHPPPPHRLCGSLLHAHVILITSSYVITRTCPQASVEQVAAASRLLSRLVATQADQIEQLHADAVDATTYLSRGNTEVGAPTPLAALTRAPMSLCFWCRGV